MPDITFVYGNDEFGIARKLKEFEGNFTDPTSASMNTARLEARTVNDNDLNTALNAMPFLAAQRVVFLANPSARYTKPTDRRKFEEFLLAIPDSTRLVMYETLNLKPREMEGHWLVKWAAKNHLKALPCLLPHIKEMPGWMINEARKQGGALEPAAAARLAEMVGVDTRQAGMEIAKLLAYVNWSRPIGLADVEAVSITTAEPDIFALVDALSNGNTPLAQKTLHRLLEDSDAMALWGMIIRQFRLLLLAREVLDAHGMVPDVQEALKVHPFVAEKISAQAKNFKMPALENIYRRLLLMDEAAKTGRMPLEVSLDLFVGDLAIK